MPEVIPNKGIDSGKVRKSLYHVTAAVLAIVGIFGLITAEEAESYLKAAVLILGVAPAELAAVNTPKQVAPDGPQTDGPVRPEEGPDYPVI